MFVFLGSVFLLFIGAFLPWVKVGMFGVNGIEGDGILTLILAIIAIILYFVFHKKAKFVKIATIAIGAFALLIVIGTYFNIGEQPLASSASGLFITLIGSIGLIASPFIKR